MITVFRNRAPIIIPGLFVVLLVLGLGCSGKQDSRKDPPPPPPPPATATLKEKEDAEAGRAREAAEQETDPTEKLKKEINALRKERDIAQREANTASVMIGTKEKELNALRLQTVQTWLYIAAGALLLAAVALSAIAIYFRSGRFAWSAVIAVGAACFVAFTGWLTPYALYIVIAGGSLFILFIGVLVWMLFGRDKALFQLTKGMHAIKSQVPNYKELVGDHIDHAQDQLIDSVRERWNDPSLKK